MAKSVFRLIITVKDQPRKLMTFTERNNGDLAIDVKPAPLCRPVASSVVLGPRYKSNLISIHKSLKSLTGNTFTSTRVLATGEVGRYQQFTKALKSSNQFAPVLFRRYPILSSNETEIDDGTTPSLSLGAMDEDRFSLIIG